jgi:hypothetical protein
VLIALLFAMGVYNSEAMSVLNSVFLAIVSMICVVEMTIYSHRFRTVLTTLGAINQARTSSW